MAELQHRPQRQMYERAYGSNYDKTMTTKDIAAEFRKRVKQLVKDGVLPADWKYSTRYRSYAGGASIDVVAKSPHPVRLQDTGIVRAPGHAPRDVKLAVRGEMHNCRIRPGDQWEVRYDDVALAMPRLVHDTLKELLDSFNYDGSEVQVDYFDRNFYGFVNIEPMDGVPRSIHPLPPYLPEGGK